MNLKEETLHVEHQSKWLTIEQEQEQGLSLGSMRTIKAETQEPCLNVGEHSYTGRSPARSVNLASPTKPLVLKMEGVPPSQENQVSSCLECCKSKASHLKSEECKCCCGTLATPLSSESTQNSSEERVNDKIWTKKKKRKKSRGREQLLSMKRGHKQLQHVDGMSPEEAANSPKVTTAIKRKDKKKKHKAGEEKQR